MSESLEYTILTKRECFAYQVKSVSAGGGGFKATEFSSCVWKGRLQVCAKDNTLIVKLVSTDGSIFVACPVTASSTSPIDNFVERTVDSSRYFVLKLSDGVNSNKRALLGFGFDDRNDAFDFNACLVDFFAAPAPSAPGSSSSASATSSASTKRDFSLKAGEKISVGALLRPAVVAVASAPAAPAPAGADFLDDLDFGDFQASPAPASAGAAVAGAAAAGAGAAAVPNLLD